MKALLAVLLTLVLLPTQARADDIRPGYLEWTESAPGQWAVTWRAPLLGGLATRARPIVPGGCRSDLPRRAFEGPVMVERRSITCSAALDGHALGLEGLATGFSDALLRVAPLDRPIEVTRLTAAEPTAIVTPKERSGGVFAEYVKLGVEHILLGFDHLLFVVALVLLIRGWRAIVATVTAFTVAHSLTLAATTLGLVSVTRKPVEICIALSIVLVAREILRPPNTPPTLARRAPALIAFAFGLLHGFGFAAALAEIGLPEGDVPLALLAFNLGVEAGQLLIVAAALAMIAAVKRLAPTALRPATAVCAYAIGALSSAWLIERVLT